MFNNDHKIKILQDSDIDCNFTLKIASKKDTTYKVNAL